VFGISEKYSYICKTENGGRSWDGDPTLVIEKVLWKDCIGKIADRPISAEPHRESEMMSKMEPLSDCKLRRYSKISERITGI
jgi:hypothetical protein